MEGELISADCLAAFHESILSHSTVGESILAFRDEYLDDLTRYCEHCGEENEALARCSACKAVHYCSAECQKVDWSQGGHKIECAAIASGVKWSDLAHEFEDTPDPASISMRHYMRYAATAAAAAISDPELIGKGASRMRAPRQRKPRVPRAQRKQARTQRRQARTQRRQARKQTRQMKKQTRQMKSQTRQMNKKPGFFARRRQQKQQQQSQPQQQQQQQPRRPGFFSRLRTGLADRRNSRAANRAAAINRPTKQYRGPKALTSSRRMRAQNYTSRWNQGRLGPRFGRWGRGVGFGGYRWGYWGGWSFPWVLRAGAWYPWWFHIPPRYYGARVVYIDPYTGQNYGVPPAAPGTWGTVPAPPNGTDGYENPPEDGDVIAEQPSSSPPPVPPPRDDEGLALASSDTAAPPPPPPLPVKSFFHSDMIAGLLLDHPLETYSSSSSYQEIGASSESHWKGHDGGPMISLEELCHNWSGGEYELVGADYHQHHHQDAETTDFTSMIEHELLIGLGFDADDHEPLDFAEHALKLPEEHLDWIDAIGELI